jgi:ElaB/YqjD/DUF883 family membrane-anchored ribosome-binding protein
MEDRSEKSFVQLASDATDFINQMEEVKRKKAIDAAERLLERVRSKISDLLKDADYLFNTEGEMDAARESAQKAKQLAQAAGLLDRALKNEEDFSEEYERLKNELSY